MLYCFFFFCQAEDGIRYLVRSRGIGEVYKRQDLDLAGDDRRAARGGSWYSNAERSSVAARGDGFGLVNFSGFRVVCAASR